MAKAYNVGDRLYLPVWVTEKETNVMMGPDKSTTITDAKFSYTYCLGRVNTGKVRYGEEGLLLTAEEIYASRRMVDEVEHLTDMLDYGRKKYDEIEELKARNAELEALLKEVMATRDEAIKQNNELIADRNNWKEASQRYHDNAKVADKATEELRKENKDLKAKVAENADTISRLSANKVALTEEVARLRETIADRTIDVQHLTEENDKLKTDLEQRNKDFWAMKKDRDNILADSKRTTEWYMEANRTATEAAEANDELKAKIADLRNRVGEQLAQIQDLNAEVHFHKEFGEGLDKQQKELQARYDELDSVNKEQAEKIRKLDAERDTWERNAKAWKMTADGMSKRAEELQTENEKLNNRNKYLESEKNRKPIVHVLTNDGHVYAFTSSGKASVKYHTELNILMIEDGEKTIAGFSRGDKPGNLSAWWMG